VNFIDAARWFQIGEADNDAAFRSQKHIARIGEKWRYIEGRLMGS